MLLYFFIIIITIHRKTYIVHCDNITYAAWSITIKLDSGSTYLRRLRLRRQWSQRSAPGDGQTARAARVHVAIWLSHRTIAGRRRQCRRRRRRQFRRRRRRRCCCCYCCGFRERAVRRRSGEAAGASSEQAVQVIREAISSRPGRSPATAKTLASPSAEAPGSR